MNYTYIIGYHSYFMNVNFQNFREGLCGYEGDRLEDLDSIPTLESCQLACQHYKKDPETTCRFFVYDSGLKSCELLNSGERKCDMVRGTPQPEFLQCRDDGYINWPDTSEN